MIRELDKKEAKRLVTLILSVEEGFREKAYKDTEGNYTVGFGETLMPDGKRVSQWSKMTLEQATERLSVRVDSFLASVLKSCPNLCYEPDWRVAACVSLAYNIGEAAFRTSSVCRKMGAGDLKGAENSFLLWNKETIKGQKVVNRGLNSRRIREAQLFANGTYNYSGVII